MAIESHRIFHYLQWKGTKDNGCLYHTINKMNKLRNGPDMYDNSLEEVRETQTNIIPRIK